MVGSTRGRDYRRERPIPLAVPRSLVRGDRLQVKVDALGLPPDHGRRRLRANADRRRGAEPRLHASRSPSGRAPPAPRRRRRCRSTSSPASRSRRRATPRPRRSSSRWRRPSTSRGRRSPTAPTPCGRRRCAASGPTRCWCSINGKRRHQSALVHLNGSIGRGSTGVDLNAIPVVGDRAHRGPARRRRRAVRLGRHRRRDQHRAQGRRVAARR